MASLFPERGWVADQNEWSCLVPYGQPPSWAKLARKTSQVGFGGPISLIELGVLCPAGGYQVQVQV